MPARRPRGLRLLVASVATGSFVAGCTLLAELSDHVSVVGGSETGIVDAGEAGTADTNTADTNTVADANEAGPGLAFVFDPAEAELHPGAGRQVTFQITSPEGFGSDVHVLLAPAIQDASIAPLTVVDGGTLDLPKALPQGAFSVQAQSSAKDGRYGLTLVAETTNDVGTPVRTRTTYPVRVVGDPGRLDTGLGGGAGYVDFCPSPATACTPGEVFVYPDGRWLVAGTATLPVTPFTGLLLARFLADGTPDPTFGTGGTGVSIQAVPGITGYHGVSIAQVPDKSLVVAFFESINVVLVHVKDDGLLDSSFGTGGRVMTNVAAGGAVRAPMTLTPQGRVAVAGFINEDPAPGAIREYFVDGGNNPSFGDGGLVTFSAAPSMLGSSITVDPTQLYVGGTATDGGVSGAGFVSVFFLPSGNIVRTTPVNGPGAVRTNVVRLAQQGTSTLAGSSVTTSGNGKMIVTRLLPPSGFVDPLFGVNGVVTPDTGVASFVVPSALVVQSDGKFLVSRGQAGQTFFIARYDANGTLDPGFGTAGIAESVPGVVSSMAFVENGRQLLVVGSDKPHGTPPTRLRIARYWLR